MNKRKVALWNEIKVRSKRIETQMNPLTRKRTGSYYTDLTLTDVMMRELVQHLDKKNIANYKFLEPCVGTGNFVFSYLKALDELFIDLSEFQKILANIYVADINQTTTSDNLFAKDDFINKTKKKKYILQKRIACQQIANMHKARRITFAFIPPNSVLEIRAILSLSKIINMASIFMVCWDCLTQKS